MWMHHSPVSATVQPRGVSEQLAAPESMAGRVHNFVVTPEGTLRSVQAPVELVSRYKHDGSGGALGSAYTQVTDYGPMAECLGIFHACLDEDGSREVLLAHFDGYVRSAQGWQRGTTGAQGVWKNIIGDTILSPWAQEALTEDGTSPGFLTQFLKIPTGVLIIPQGTRAYVYNGYSIMPLGYDHPPAAPEPLYPKNKIIETPWAPGVLTNFSVEPNGAGYSVRGRNVGDFDGCQVMGVGRIGTTTSGYLEAGTNSNPAGGVLESGEWRACVQWVNNHGDLSPDSGYGAPATCAKEDNLTSTRTKLDLIEPAEQLKFQIAWTNISPGPAGTRGRIVGRTRDLEVSGDATLYEIPAYSAPGAHALATLPDNESWLLSDNVPDSWLVQPITPVDAMPVFRLACLWMGRLWIANMLGAPGMLRASYPGRWGTLPKARDIFYPDPTGAAVTGLFAVGTGMLVFTESSTFLMEPSDDGASFKFRTLHSKVGCVAPNSVATRANGTTVWLSREGFMAWSPGDAMPVNVSEVHLHKTVQRINKTWRVRACAVVDPWSGEYRCWVPTGISKTNDLCIVYDGKDWRTRDEIKASAVCVTSDQLQYVVALGTARSSTGTDLVSTWVQDHSGLWTREVEYDGVEGEIDEVPEQPTAVFESHWLRGTRSHRKGSPVRVKLWLRETRVGGAKMEIMRDWREYPVIQTSEDTDPQAPTLYTSQDPPLEFDDAVLGGTSAQGLFLDARGRPVKAANQWRERRVFWQKYDISVPSAETFKIRLTVEGDCEIVGFNFTEHSHTEAGGASEEGGRT